MAKAKAKSKQARPAKPKPKAKPARDAAEELARTVGTPDNINTVAVDQLSCVKRWLTLDEASRVRVVDELTAALEDLTRRPVFREIKSYAWTYVPEFTAMVSLGKAIDRMIRARLPLSEATLCSLAYIVSQRSDLSALRLAAQLEHRAKHHTIAFPLELAIAAMICRFGWDKDLIARLWAIIGPAVDHKRADPVEARLLSDVGSGDAASLLVYADWLEERGDHRCAAYLRFAARPLEQRYADEHARLSILVDPAWRARVDGGGASA